MRILPCAFSSFLNILKHSPVLIQTKDKYLWRKTNSTALHTDFQTVWWFTTGIHDATIHVTRAVAVIPHFISTATAAGFWGAYATRSLSQDNIAEGQEFTEQAGQDTVDTTIFRWRAWLLGKDCIHPTLLTDIAVYGQAGLYFSMHFLRNRCWKFLIFWRYIFGPMVNSISIAQTFVTVFYLAYFFFTQFLGWSLKLRQALRLGSDEFIIWTISPNGLVLHLSMCKAAIGDLSYISFSIFFITFFLGRCAQAAIARLGPALGPGS